MLSKTPVEAMTQEQLIRHVRILTRLIKQNEKTCNGIRRRNKVRVKRGEAALLGLLLKTEQETQILKEEKRKALNLLTPEAFLCLKQRTLASRN